MVDLRFHLDRTLAFIRGMVAANAHGRSGCIEQAPARTGQRRVDVFQQHAVEQRARLGGQKIVQFQLAVVHREGGPLQLGHQVRIGVAPGLVHGLLAAQQGDRLEGAAALKPQVIGNGEFTAPQFAVVPVAQAIERHADHRPAVQRPAVVDQTRRDVRMVVQHLDRSVAGARGVVVRELGGQVFGMRIAGAHRRLEGEEALQVMQRAAVVGVGGGVFEVADVLRQHGLAAVGTSAQQAKGVLQFAAVGQHRWRSVEPGRHGDGLGHQATGAAQHTWRAVHHAQHRVVDAPGDRPVVVEHEVDAAVGTLTEAVGELVQRDRLRLVAEVAAGQHDGPLHALQDQVMDAGVREHEAERVQARCHGVGDLEDVRGDTLLHITTLRRVMASAQQHDRCGGRRQGCGLGLADIAPGAHRVDSRRHQREGLALAPFQFAQPRHGVGLCRVAGELVAAQALDGDDVAACQQRAGGVAVVEEGVGVDREGAPVQPLQADLRAADVAGDGLGMEAPVGRGLVFGPAGSAHRIAGHRGQRAVVGHTGDERQTRAAVGAVGQRVAKAAREGVEDFGHAGCARGRVCGH